MRRTRPFGWLVCLALLAMNAVIPSAKAHAAEGAWLGVSTQELTSSLREGLDYEGDGVLVTSVIAGSPADQAGVRKGDILLSFNSRTLTSPEQLRTLVTEARPGREVALGIVRDGERRTLSAELATRETDELSPEAPTSPIPPLAPRAPREPREPEVHVWKDGKEIAPEALQEHLRGFMGDTRSPLAGGAGRGRLGVRIESLNPDLAQALGGASLQGVLVLEVLGGTAAEKAGIKAGDIITSVDRESVSDTDDLVRALRDEEGRVSIGVVRRGVKRTIEATLEDTPRVMRFRSGDGQLGIGRLREMERPRVRVERDTDRDGLREELERLRSELRDLKRELEESKR